MISKYLALFGLLLVGTCVAKEDPEDAAMTKRLLAVKDRMVVTRRDSGDEGIVFTVKITAPEKPSYDPAKFTDLSDVARAVDVPCKKVEIGLNSYGPDGWRDLSLMLGFHAIPPNGDLFLEFRLPKSHGGHEKGLPSLLLICSGIHKEKGKFIDWQWMPLNLMEAKDLTKGGMEPKGAAPGGRSATP